MKILTKIHKKIIPIECMAFIYLNSIVSYAADNEASKELKKLLTNSSGTGLMDILQKVGFVIIAIGLGKTILAFKDDNPADKAKGSMVILAGAFLYFIKDILKLLGAL